MSELDGAPGAKKAPDWRARLESGGVPGDTGPGNLSEDAGSNERARFDALMRQEGPRIYALALRLAGNAADGQDLAADTFVRAFRAFGSFRGDAAFGSWVYRICLNTWKNRLRTRQRRFFWSHFSLGGRDDEDAPAFDPPSPEPPPDAPLEKEERRRRVADALDSLGAEDRTILVLRDVEDKPYEEIAELLGLPLGTVKSRLARARLKLRDLLKDTL
jgi:RNA polymerase sigma factor (sigma-70 family)